jgi:hypothetical protein
MLFFYYLHDDNHLDNLIFTLTFISFISNSLAEFDNNFHFRRCKKKIVYKYYDPHNFDQTAFTE